MNISEDKSSRDEWNFPSRRVAVIFLRSLNRMGLIFVFAFSSLFAADDLTTLPPPKKKKSSWQAKVFVASAFAAIVTGIVVICLDNGTNNEVIKSNNEEREKREDFCCDHEPIRCCETVDEVFEREKVFE